MEETTKIHVDLDVHKDSIAVAVAVMSLMAIRRRVAASLRPAPLVTVAAVAVAAGGVGWSTSMLGAGPFLQTAVAIGIYCLVVGLVARPSISDLVGGEEREPTDRSGSSSPTALAGLDAASDPPVAAIAGGSGGDR